MPSKSQEQLFDAFLEAAGTQMQSLTQAIGSTVELANQLGSTDRLGETPAPSSTSAGGSIYGSSATSVGSDVRSAAATSQQNNSGESTAGSIVSTFFESGFGMAALVKGLVGLFTGGGSSTPPPLQRYEMPASILFDSAETQGGLQSVDYDQLGRPRAVPVETDAGPATTSPSAASGSAAVQQAAPQITVNVQAMDAQSFLDHSNQIAQAVRGAMLNLSSINDVVNEL